MSDKRSNEDVLESWEKPNAFVVQGPSGPLMVTFDDDGKVSGRGGEFAKAAQLFPRGLVSDALVLVHVVEGKSGMLVKSLETNELVQGGSPVSAVRMHRSGLLSKMAMELRERYVKKAARVKRGQQPVKETPCHVSKEAAQ